MDNNDIIAKLTLGTDETEKVTVSDKDGKDIEVTLRPLTSGELSILQKMENAPYTMKIKINKNGERIPVNREDRIQENNDDDGNNMDVPMGEFTEAKSKVMYTAVAWSMDIPLKAVQGFMKGVPEILFEHVLRISNITSDDLTSLKQFRNNK